MAQKRKKANKTAPPSSGLLRNRIQAALKEHRIPQAMELTQQFIPQAATEADRQFVRDAFAAGAKYQIDRESLMDARHLLEQAEKIQGPNNWWETLALFRARLGDSACALQLLEKVPGSTIAPRVYGHLVDRALRDTRNGKLRLAKELHAGFDIVVTAFEQYHRGDDEAAKQTLQTIGLQSPYLEWKLLIRGLMAYAVNDDARAIENWQRLDADRLPAKISEPLRFSIDAAFRNSLGVEKARNIARRTDRVSHPILASLRDLQRLTGTAENLPQALRQVQSLLGLLKMNFPQQVPKIANCFYWLIIHGGQPEDLDKYSRAFGAPPDDKNFHRLQALVLEGYPHFDDANEFWGSYLEEIEGSPDRWPGEFGKRARAMILTRMGDNAQHFLEEEDEDDDDEEDFMSFFNPVERKKAKGKPKKKLIVPSPETCYRRAVELAPNWSEPALRLLDLLQNQERYQEAEQVGDRLLQLFPDDVNALMIVAAIRQLLGKTTEAAELMRRALKNNPLDRDLRTRVAMLALQSGRLKTVEAAYEEARAAFKEAIELEPLVTGMMGRAAWAACEYKASNPERAAELLAELNARPEMRTLATYFLAVEYVRAKLSKPLIKEAQDNLDRLLASDLTLVDINTIAVAFSSYRVEKPAYRGIGTHEKKIQALYEKAIDAGPSEEDLVEIGFCLIHSGFTKVLKTCADRGRIRYPNNPAFQFFAGEQAILQRPKSFNMGQVGYMFRSVLKAIENKTDERSKSIRERIDERVEEFPELDMYVNQRSFMDFPW